MNLDTTFLIDLHREQSGRSSTGALAFLQAHPQTRFHVSAVAAMEFLEGFADPRNGERFLMPFKVVVLDEPAGRIAANIRRSLREAGTLIGDPDILIAATALRMGESLVTANSHHFKRIQGLDWVSYRKKSPGLSF
jgi:predicted nucleic acid-binding protein